MAEESGRPGTSRSKVGWPAIDEPCTNRMMPLAWAGSASHLFHRKSFTLPSLVVQCSAPARRCGEGEFASDFGSLATSFMAAILVRRGARSFRFDVIRLDQLCPFGDLGLDVLAELLRRHRVRIGVLLDPRVADVGAAENLVDLAVEPLDDRLRG